MNTVVKQLMELWMGKESDETVEKTLLLPKRWENVRDDVIVWALSYRTPKYVYTSRVYEDGIEFPICPGCADTIEREYMRYCDRCGQALNWQLYDDRIIYRRSPKRK